MANENLQNQINRLSYEELSRLLLDVAANPGVREHIAITLETSEFRSSVSQVYQHERRESDSSIRTAPPPYSTTTSLIRRYSLHARNWHYGRASQQVYMTPLGSQPVLPLPPRACVCRNCKQAFWSHEQSEPVTDCVGHPGRFSPHVQQMGCYHQHCGIVALLMPIMSVAKSAQASWRSCTRSSRAARSE